jgi:hypothetical protein
MRVKTQSHNRPKPPEEVELAPGYTITRYITLKKQRDRKEIAHLILARFDHRFFEPLGYSVAHGQWNQNISGAKPSGWLMTSISCLAIEALMNFVKGTKRVQAAGREFNEFFEANEEFAALSKAFPAFKKAQHGKSIEDNRFYCDIRCGLLHQGETYRGWRLLLGQKDDAMVDDLPLMRCIYARPIVAGVGQAIRRYCEGLLDDDDFTTASGSQWSKALRKLDAISEMCGVEHNTLGNPVVRKNLRKATIRTL